MADIKDRAREYLAKHSEYSEVFRQTFIAVDTLTAMVDFAEQETKELKEQIEKMKRHANCKHCDSEGYCEVRRTYLIDLSYNGCDKWELED
jgi:intein-encoded DNA endonuclease-like protein